MRHKAVKVGLTTLVLSGALGGLLWTTLSEGTEYYKHVDEVMVNPAAWYGKPLQMHGYVVNAMRARNSLDYRFEVENNGAVVAAEYTGIVPDTFQDGAEVVVQGRLSPDVFTVRPNGIMAKCPSKYEPKPGTPAGPGQATSAGPT